MNNFFPIPRKFYFLFILDESICGFSNEFFNVIYDRFSFHKSALIFLFVQVKSVQLKLAIAITVY